MQEKKKKNPHLHIFSYTDYFTISQLAAFSSLNYYTSPYGKLLHNMFEKKYARMFQPACSFILKRDNFEIEQKRN